jgi:hypothetical protein
MADPLLEDRRGHVAVDRGAEHDGGVGGSGVAGMGVPCHLGEERRRHGKGRGRGQREGDSVTARAHGGRAA